MKCLKYLLLFIVAFTTTVGLDAMQVNNLRTERRFNPIGIGSSQPRLSWEIVSTDRSVMQSAYHILVASSPEKLAANVGDLWDSKQVDSDASVNVYYAGTPLKSRTQAWWKVKVWCNGKECDWSSPASFTMGLLVANEWDGRWIGLDRSFAWDSEEKFAKLSARYFRREFENKTSVKRATAYIIGLGLYELYLNGQKVGNDVLSPMPTDYTKSVMGNTFDVTSMVKNGQNAIGVILGNGRFYNMRQNFKPYKIKTFGYPKMLFQLEVEYVDGSKQTILSNDTWKVTADGPIRSGNEYDGEIYDATKELSGWAAPGYDDSKWLGAQLVQEPGGTPVCQSAPNMKIVDQIKPISVKSHKNGAYIIDMGQNMAGWLRIMVEGNKGDSIKIRFAETLQEDGSLYVANLRHARSTDVYIVKGGCVESWEPRFTYHGFRFVEIQGLRKAPDLQQFTGCVVSDEMSVMGSFLTSSDILNKIYKNACWGIRSNYKGMPVDCPQRDERQPWMADRAMGVLGESFIFDNGLFYEKWLADMEQSQNIDGAIPDVVPSYIRYYSDNMTWPGTYLIIADILYNQYGDVRPIKSHYASMKKWLMYMQQNYMDNYILTRDCYGDWCMPPESKELIHSRDSLRQTDGQLISTAYFYHFMNLMQKFAVLSGEDRDVPMYKEFADSVKVHFNDKFFNVKTSQYSNNTVTANLLPLTFGMVDKAQEEKVFGQIIEKTVRENNSHITSGLIGTQWFMRTLSKYGRSDVAYRIATNRDYPSWGYMVDNGATTIWELWNGNTANPAMNSHNHVMLLGDLIGWLYEDLGAIKSDESGAGYKTIIMKPQDVDGLEFVNASYQSMHGLIKSEWKNISYKSFDWSIQIPCNSKALVYIPVRSGSVITESGKPVDQVAGVKYLRNEGRYNVYEVGSGNYHFLSVYKWKDGIIKDEFVALRPGYPESHGATIAETPAGLVASWFGGTKERNPDMCIYVSRMVKGAWSEPQNVANGIVNDTLRLATWNPVLYQIPDGELMLFYKVGPNVAGWKGYYITSKDNGISWSSPYALPDGFIGSVKNKPVLLGKNTLMCPSSMEGNGWKVHFEVTKDWGKTWEKIGPINDGKDAMVIQPSILFHKNGRLQVLCRSRNRAVMSTWSEDGGKSWSDFKALGLPNNNSGTDAVTLKDGRQLLVYNHVLPPDGMHKGARTPLNVSVSKDGINWEACLILEDSPISQYSYPSVIQTKDGMVHIVYTWRRERVKHVVVDPKKLKPIEIKEGIWPGKESSASGKFKSEED